MPDQIDFDPTADYYKELGIPETSSADEVKKAYRQLAKQYHPDSTGGDKVKESKFKTVSVAYEVLGDAKRRALYDQYRTTGGMPVGFGGYSDYPIVDLVGAFAEFFGAKPAPPPRQPPRSPMPRGAAPRASTSPRSSARRPSVSRFDPYHSSPSPPQGNNVQASDGSWLRADGFDVQSDIFISFDQAFLGATITVPTIDGMAEVKIPAGSSSGRKLRLRGKGMPNPGGFTGDHHLVVHIAIPEEIDDEAIEMILKLARHLRKTRRS